MTSEEFWACVTLNLILFAILNIWLLWGWSLLIATCLIWGGFIIIDSDIDIFD
jgi:hypothetical protein